MDSEEFRAILSRSGVGIWALIEAAIEVAGSDYGDELRRRRDGIVEQLYASAGELCKNCSGVKNDDVDRDQRLNNRSSKVHYISDGVDDNDIRYDGGNRNSDEDLSKRALTPGSNHSDGEDEDPYGGLFDDDEQTTILGIKEQLEDPDQSEDAVVGLLQNLSDMDITFQALKETDIGRHVNLLRKHPSNEVRRLVKQLVRKWKDTVDEWVDQPQSASNLTADLDSPQQNIPKNQQNGHHQVPDFGYSPNPRNGSSSVERNNAEHESKPKAPQSATRREVPSRPPQSVPKSASSAPPPNRAQRETIVDDERLNSARKRLQENYQEAQNGLTFNFEIFSTSNITIALQELLFYLFCLSLVRFSHCEARKQRKIQVMDIHEIPKPKNSFFSKNKGGFQGRQHR